MLKLIDRFDDGIIAAFQYIYDLFWDAFDLRLGTANLAGVILICACDALPFALDMTHQIVSPTKWLVASALTFCVVLSVVAGIAGYMTQNLVPYRSTNELQSKSHFVPWNAKALLQCRSFLQCAHFLSDLLYFCWHIL